MNRIQHRLLLLLAVAALTVAPAFAQQGPPERRGDMNPQQRLDQLAEALALTDDQRAELRPLLADHHVVMVQLRGEMQYLRQQVRDGEVTRGEADAQRAAFQERRQAERAAFVETVKPILTPEQQKQLTEMMAKRGDRGPRDGRRLGPRDGRGRSASDG